MNGPITSNEIGTVIKKIPTNESPVEFYQTFSEELIIIPFLLKHSQTHSMGPPSPWYQNQTNIPQKKKTTGQFH